MIVDTHVHVVSDDQQRYPRDVTVIGTNWVEEMPVDTESLLQFMDEAGIDRTVLVQALGAYKYDNNYSGDSAMRYPERFVGVCIVDPEQDDAAVRLAYWVQERGFKGVRLFTQEATWLDDPKTYPVWEKAEELGIPVCVITPFSQLPRLRRVLERFPNVRLALDHMSRPRLEEGPPYKQAGPLFDLAEYPNMHLKFSSINMYDSSKGKSTPEEFFGRLVERFGARRLMWGSNFPATYDRPLKEQLQIARDSLSFLPDGDQRWLLGESALALWPSLRGTAA